MAVAFIAPLVMAAVLACSAVAKLWHPDDIAGWRELGVPEPLLRSGLLRLHPWGELALAAALVLLGGALGAIAALVCIALMAAYLWLVVGAVRRDPDASCACFGERRPIGRVAIVRNAWLLLVSIAALGGVWASPVVGGTALAILGGAGVTPLEATLGALLAALTAAVVARPEPSGPTTRAIEAAADPGRRPGDEDLQYIRPRVPAVTVRLGGGATANLRDLSSRAPILLLAVSETCRPCGPVIDRTPAWRKLLPGVQVRFLIALPPAESSITEPAEPQSLHDPEQHVRASIAEWGTPTALLLGADGLLVGEPVTGYGEIAELVADIAESLHGERPGDGELHGRG